MISYAGIDEAVLVHALYHGAAQFAPNTPAGLINLLHGGNQVTLDVVRQELAGRLRDRDGSLHIDYFRGRPLKIELNPATEEFSPRLYDRDAGEGAAQRVVDRLRADVATLQAVRS